MPYRSPQKSNLKLTGIAKEIKTYQRYEVTLIAEALNVSRSSIYYKPSIQNTKDIGMAKYYQKSADESILLEIKNIIAIRATYGYRRITTMLNRERILKGKATVNRKRVQRIMQVHGLSLPRIMPKQKCEYNGKVMTLFPNLRWCSDGSNESVEIIPRCCDLRRV